MTDRRIAWLAVLVFLIAGISVVVSLVATTSYLTATVSA